MTVKSIEKTISKLPPAERIHIVENVLASLHAPNPAIERAWVKESDKRLNAIAAGKIKGISLESIKKYFAR